MMKRICDKCRRRPWAFDPGQPGASCWWSGCAGTLVITKLDFLPLDPYPIGHARSRCFEELLLPVNERKP